MFAYMIRVDSCVASFHHDIQTNASASCESVKSLVEKS